MRARSTPAERSGRRSGSIAISPTVPPTRRMRRRTDLPATRSWKSFWRAHLRAGDVGRRGRSGRAARM